MDGINSSTVSNLKLAPAPCAISKWPIETTLVKYSSTDTKATRVSNTRETKEMKALHAHNLRN